MPRSHDLWNLWSTLYIWVFDQNSKCISDGGAGGFSSCQKQIHHSGDQILIQELGCGKIFLLRGHSWYKYSTRLDAQKNQGEVHRGGGFNPPESKMTGRQSIELFLTCSIRMRKQSMKSLGELGSRDSLCSWIFVLTKSLRKSICLNIVWWEPGRRSMMEGKTLYICGKNSLQFISSQDEKLIIKWDPKCF